MLRVFDQIALTSLNIEEDVKRFIQQGHLDWVQDTVDVQHIFVNSDLQDTLGSQFTVKLAFNYSLVPGTEFELIELIKGWTVQLLQSDRFSHMGYHTIRDQSDDGTIDSLLEELMDLKKNDATVLQISQTVAHLNTNKRYRYAFVQGACCGDTMVKIIQRLLPDKQSSRSVERSLQEGRELFQCLNT